MKNVREHFAASFSQLTEAAQALVLTRILLRFTLEGRGTYSVGDDRVNDAALLRKCNEAQHRIASQILHILLSDRKRYPDDVFANVIVDQFESMGMSPTTALKIIESCMIDGN